MSGSGAPRATHDSMCLPTCAAGLAYITLPIPYLDCVLFRASSFAKISTPYFSRSHSYLLFILVPDRISYQILGIFPNDFPRDRSSLVLEELVFDVPRQPYRLCRSPAPIRVPQIRPRAPSSDPRATHLTWRVPFFQERTPNLTVWGNSEVKICTKHHGKMWPVLQLLTTRYLSGFCIGSRRRACRDAVGIR